MVHPGGRPRTVSFSVEEMIALGEEMVEWVKINKPIHLSIWYTQEKDFTDSQWDSFRKRPEFVHYYTKALKLVGYSYLDKDSQVDVRLKDRWQRVYFKDLREEEDQTLKEELERKKEFADHQAKLQKEEIQTYSKELEAKFDLHMTQIDNLQNPQNILTP